MVNVLEYALENGAINDSKVTETDCQAAACIVATISSSVFWRWCFTVSVTIRLTRREALYSNVHRC
jgi:hypothetical protein